MRVRASSAAPAPRRRAALPAADAPDSESDSGRLPGRCPRADREVPQAVSVRLQPDWPGAAARGDVALTQPSAACVRARGRGWWRLRGGASPHRSRMQTIQSPSASATGRPAARNRKDECANACQRAPRTDPPTSAASPPMDARAERDRPHFAFRACEPSLANIDDVDAGLYIDIRLVIVFLMSPPCSAPISRSKLARSIVHACAARTRTAGSGVSGRARCACVPAARAGRPMRGGAHLHQPLRHHRRSPRLICD